jgi:hypothetical protein
MVPPWAPYRTVLKWRWGRWEEGLNRPSKAGPFAFHLVLV